MRLTWRNGIAYMLLAVAVGQYVISAPWYLAQLAAERSPDAVAPAQSSLSLIVGWLALPIPIIGWAAVVEYLSRIATVLQKRNSADGAE